MEASAYTCNQQRSTIRVKQGLRQDRTSCVGCVVKASETQAHVLAKCSKLAQSRYLIHNDAALKIPFYKMLKDLDLMNMVPPWYLLEQPKPFFESDKGKACWGVQVFAENVEARNNNNDAGGINKE